MKKTLIFLFTLSIFGCESRKNEQKASTILKPNIIYILADDLGYGDVKCFNPEGKIPTPNLDKMAINGIMFTDAHTSSAVCIPTRYGILTGLYNWRTSLKSFVLSGYSKSLIRQERTTIAEMLKAQGYNTAFIGKWHLGWDWTFENEEAAQNIDKLSAKPEVDFNSQVNNGPSSYGFDYSFGFSGSLDMPPYVYVENGIPTSIPAKSTVSVDEKGFWREKLELPPMQLYNLKEDIGETQNLITEYPEKALELKNAFAKIILDGRSTSGATQENDGMEGWKQIEPIIN